MILELQQNIVIILICIVGIGKSGIWLVGSPAKIVKRLGTLELVIPLTIVAFGASALEFVISIVAALRVYYGSSGGNLMAAIF